MKDVKDQVAVTGAAPRDVQDPRRPLDRIMATPRLAQVIPRLQPELLHRIIQGCGLEECGELVALATPAQLTRVFDLDLWRTGQPGLDEHFDVARFGVWLQVLVESGADVAAQKLAEMDADLVTAGLAQYVRVFDLATLTPSASVDGAEVAANHPLERRLQCDIGGCRIVATRADSWDAIVAVLIALEAEDQDAFHRVISRCRNLSNSKPEVDGLDNLLTAAEQAMFDLALDREQRREKQGYATPAQARAFLNMSRQLQRGPGTTPPGNPVTRAYFRAVEWTTAAEDNRESGRLPSGSGAPPASEDVAGAVAAVVDVLLDTGVLTQPPRALLDAAQGSPSRLARIQAHMRFVCDRDYAAYSMRNEELAYLANTIVAGCSIQARPFTPREAFDAAVAVSNLGLENWPRHWVPGLPAKAQRGSPAVEAGTPLPDDFLLGQDLISVFQVGWTILHDDVSMYTAKHLIEVLTGLRCEDRETQRGLDQLRVEMGRHWRAGSPWRAQDALDVIAILDMPAWATLVGLTGECPVIHAAIAASQGSRTRAVSATAFEFISENSQIASVREFMQALPETLRA